MHIFIYTRRVIVYTLGGSDDSLIASSLKHHIIILERSTTQRETESQVLRPVSSSLIAAHRLLLLTTADQVLHGHVLGRLSIGLIALHGEVLQMRRRRRRSWLEMRHTSCRRRIREIHLGRTAHYRACQLMLDLGLGVVGKCGHWRGVLDSALWMFAITLRVRCCAEVARR